MTLRLTVGGVTRTVEVERAGRGWTVTIDGRTYAVDVDLLGGAREATAAGVRWMMRMAPVSPGSAEGSAAGEAPTVAARSRVIVFEPDAAVDAAIVRVDGVAVPIALAASDTARRTGDGAAATGTVVSIAAPMPGRVVAVHVQPGETVTARQAVVVVEAMKMENELRTPRAGTVRDVRVQPGQAVEAGAVLVMIGS